MYNGGRNVIIYIIFFAKSIDTKIESQLSKYPKTIQIYPLDKMNFNNISHCFNDSDKQELLDSCFGEIIDSTYQGFNNFTFTLTFKTSHGYKLRGNFGGSAKAIADFCPEIATWYDLVNLECHDPEVEADFDNFIKNK